MEIMRLPIDMIENILALLPYDDLARYRIVSKAFNKVCMSMLNRGFHIIEKRHSYALKHVKAKLPRRESERRNHPLSRHCDILTSIETRISMLNMTYSKYIDLGFCCFIPGKVLDEISRVLSIVETEASPPRAHEVLQELRDISSMAIEHFDDKISPDFRRKLQEGVQPQPRVQHVSAVVLAPLAMRQELNMQNRRAVLNTRLCLYLAAQYKILTKQVSEYKKMTRRQFTLLNFMSKQQRKDEATIADLKKRIDECDIKYSELTHTNQTVGGKASASKSTDVTSAQPLRHFSSQIKLDLSELPIGTSRRDSNSCARPNIQPRKPVIKMPSLSEADGEPTTEITNTEPAPCTSKATTTTITPKLKTKSTMAKIRIIADEIRQLTQNYETKLKQKRHNTLCPDGPGNKKVKKE